MRELFMAAGIEPPSLMDMISVFCMLYHLAFYAAFQIRESSRQS